jgi:hypothetical protein
MVSHVKVNSVFRTISRYPAVAALVLAMMPPNAASALTTAEYVRAVLRDEVAAASDSSAGVLFGVLDSLGAEPRIWAEGAVSVDDELRLGCPTAKPILAYLILNRRIPLQARITRWFPERDGYTRAHDIQVRHLLLNSSGIRDYVPMIPMHPDSAVTPEWTIELAYRHRTLLFAPGQGFEYSNTNANLLGCILRVEMGESVDALVRARFAAIAPSLRYDDGHGRYPRGYPGPWPYHWSCPGYGGGLIGTAADAMRAFAWIASQPEFVQMTRWSKPDGSPERAETDHRLGLGLFGRRDLAGCGPATFYDGDLGPCQMILACVRGRVFYVATTHPVGLERLNAVFSRLVARCVATGND